LTNLHWILETIAWVFGAGAIITTVVWGIVWTDVVHSMRAVPTLRLGQTLAATDPPTGWVCAVVPAHNEARVIEGFVRALRAETYPQLRVVLALDRCTDDTARLVRAGIAGDERFEVVEINACPDGWAGKTYAVHAGVTQARGAQDAEYLLFADADTVFEPGCIAGSLALMRQRKLDLLSLISTLTHDTWFERVVQTAAALELMRQYPLLRANGLKDRRAFANGQFMLFTRAAYDAIGGHAAVKGALLEDLALARLIVDDRRRNAGVFFAEGLLHCRMYAGWAQFRRGWKRIYTEAADRKASRLSLSATRVHFLGVVLPLWTLGCGLYGGLLVGRDLATGLSLLGFWLVATLVWLGALLRIAAVARAPAWTAPLHVVGAWLIGKLLYEAADDLRSRVPTQWGGRVYDLGVGTATPARTGGDAGPTTESTSVQPRSRGVRNPG
jgi:glycosyltransferase involved in cell wall biosynthesis